MGILDEAIRQHLDLKRKHGARDAELREIEDEAFGASEQGDPFAAGGELFGEVAAGGASESGGEEPTRLVEPQALQPEPEPTAPESAPPEPTAAESAPPEPVAPEPDLGSFEEPGESAADLSQIPGQAELPGQDEIPGQERLDEPAEDRAIPSRPGPEPEPPSPSESLEELIAEEEPFPEDTAAPPADTAEEPGPSADRGGALEVTELEPHEEPPASVPDPPPPPPPGPEPPGRARGRVDVPTQEHPPPGQTGDLPPWPSEGAEEPVEEPASGAPPLEEPGAAEEPELESGTPELYDFETEDEPLAPEGREDDEFEALGPAEEEAPYLDDEEPYAEEPAPDAGAPPDEPGTAVRPALEDEEAYGGGGLDPEESYEEDEGEDELWFEKGPPKDFDFDD